jgi:hypothetical protein
MFPKKSRTEIIGDLLSSALEEVGNSFPFVPGEPFGPDHEGEMMFYDSGQGVTYRGLANKFYSELEAELGNADAPPLFDLPVIGHKDQD